MLSLRPRLDLTWPFPDSGHISTLVALAMFRDNDNGAHAYQATKDLRFPQPGVSLTYLLLQALADQYFAAKGAADNYASPGSRAGKQESVQLLLEAAATVTSEESPVPPLMVAVLHRHRDNVQLLLHARADHGKQYHQ